MKFPGVLNFEEVSFAQFEDSLPSVDARQVETMIPDGYSGPFDRDTNIIPSGVKTFSIYEHFSPEESKNDYRRVLPDLWKNVFDSEKTSSTGQVNYHGVRVKKTVKELIMQKRLREDIQTQPGQQLEKECPVLTSMLQVNRRPSTDVLAPTQCTTPSTNHTNILTQQRHGDMSPALSEHMFSMPQSPPFFTDTGVPQDGSSPITLPVLDNKTLSPLFASSYNSLFAPSSQAQSVERTWSSPFQFEIPRSPPLLQERSTQMSFFHWQIQLEEEKLAGLTIDHLSAQDEDGDTYLHIAVAQGRRAVAYVLAKKMANFGMLDLKEHNNQSALQVSVAANHHLITQDLLSLGAQVNTRDSWGRSPLHVCAEKGHVHTIQAIQKSTQTNGQQVHVEIMNYNGLTPLHVAVLAHNAVVQELERSGDPMSLQSMGLAQNRKQLKECIQTLMAMGASCGAKDLKSGRTVLHMAAEEANMELLSLFLDQPQSLSVINLKAYNGNTALHLASSLQGRIAQVNAVRLLMRRGADPSAKNLENEQPAQLVPEGERGDQVRCILKGRGIQGRTTLH
ncbi:NF-kappa-B inhibitor zeta isoform X2 [Alosa sapidissima]|uniref:NF-kappa-B inhibitor zeta isoform X2 n=1 Tax=Alosa sapidissima TaxID=34773 RepID=UPI001C08D788|nr:NF-kappa-B inhibitor zeta isoform X2 [Alosa sapidissima]